MGHGLGKPYACNVMLNMGRSIRLTRAMQGADQEQERLNSQMKRSEGTGEQERLVRCNISDSLVTKSSATTWKLHKNLGTVLHVSGSFSPLTDSVTLTTSMMQKHREEAGIVEYAHHTVRTTP